MTDDSFPYRSSPDESGRHVMPVMSRVEAAFCRSAPWRAFTGRFVVPWVLRGEDLAGEALEIGSGAGAHAAVIAETQPHARHTATDVDPARVTAPRRRPIGSTA